MSNVVALTGKMKSRLGQLEKEIRALCITRREVSDKIADDLLEIDEQELWRSSNHSSLQTYLEALSDGLKLDAISLTPQTMSNLLRGARFRRSIDEGTLPKKYKRFVEQTSPHDRGHLSYTVRARQKLEAATGAAPINEQQALRMLIDEGYYDGQEKAAQRTSIAVSAQLRTATDPEVLTLQIRSALDRVLELFEGHVPSFTREACDDAEIRRAAKKVYRLIGKYVIEV